MRSRIHKRLVTSILPVILCVTTSLAQGRMPREEVQEMLYEAYLTQQQPLYLRAVAVLENEKAANKATGTLQEDYALALYGLMIHAMAGENKEIYDKYASKAEKAVEAWIKSGRNTAEAKAIRAGLYGVEMGFASWKGMYLGPKSSNLVEDALEEDPQCAEAWKVRANGKLFTPSMFGGSVEEAVSSYQKAVQLYESNPTPHNWRYLEALAWLGIAQQKSGDLAAAEATFNKALEKEPRFTWVKKVLLPNVQQKIQEGK